MGTRGVAAGWSALMPVLMLRRKHEVGSGKWEVQAVRRLIFDGITVCLLLFDRILE